MITYKNVYDMMHKQATSLLPSAGDIINTIGELGAIGAAYLVAASVATGIGTGWVGAHATAKGKQDYETAQKGYENEALSSDIGELTSKIQQERAANKNEEKAKPMMLMR